MRFHGSKVLLAVFLSACAHPSAVAQDGAAAQVTVLVVYRA